jgi:starch synthase
LPNARLQVYFLDNEDFFKRKFVFNDEDEKWYDDNDLRTIFFCKGAIETVKKFGWPPDVIHCSGWMTALVPLYLKTVYKKEPVFAHSKVIYTIGNESFEEKLSEDFAKKALIHATLKEKDLELFKDASSYALQRGAATYADAITFGAENVDKKLVDEFSKVKGKKVIPFKGWDTDLTEYLELYNDLASK